MKTLFLIFFSSFPLIISAQSLSTSSQDWYVPPIENVRIQKLRLFKWNVALSEDVSMGYRHLTRRDSDPSLLDFIESRNENETRGLNFSTELLLERKIRGRFWVQLGLSYSRSGYSNGNIFFTDANGDMLQEGRFINRYEAIAIPVRFKHDFFFRGKFRMYYSVGIDLIKQSLEFSRFKHIQGEEIYQKETTITNLDEMAFTTFNEYLMGGNLGVGVTYQLERFSFRLEPNMRMMINSMVDAPIYERLYNIGIKTGVAYRF